MTAALFIPLKGEHFDRFANGSKTVERRLFGKRWNLAVCRVGRDVVLSRGYGKQHRLHGTIIDARLNRFDLLDPADQTAMIGCYGEKAKDIAIVETTIYLEGVNR